MLYFCVKITQKQFLKKFKAPENEAEIKQFFHKGRKLWKNGKKQISAQNPPPSSENPDCELNLHPWFLMFPPLPLLQLEIQ